MNVKQVDGEEGEDRSCGPVNVGLCSNLERPAFFQKSLLLSEPGGPLVTPLSTFSFIRG